MLYYFSTAILRALLFDNFLFQRRAKERVKERAMCVRVRICVHACRGLGQPLHPCVPAAALHSARVG